MTQEIQDEPTEYIFTDAYYEEYIREFNLLEKTTFTMKELISMWKTNYEEELPWHTPFPPLPIQEIDDDIFFDVFEDDNVPWHVPESRVALKYFRRSKRVRGGKKFDVTINVLRRSDRLMRKRTKGV